MFISDILDKAYLTTKPPEADEILLMPAGAMVGVDHSMVVAKSVFEEVLVQYRASEPASEAILMAIGKAKDPSDPVWKTMLDNECIVGRYTDLCNDFYAQQLTQLEKQNPPKDLNAQVPLSLSMTTVAGQKIDAGLAFGQDTAFVPPVPAEESDADSSDMGGVAPSDSVVVEDAASGESAAEDGTLTCSAPEEDAVDESDSSGDIPEFVPPPVDIPMESTVGAMLPDTLGDVSVSFDQLPGDDSPTPPELTETPVFVPPSLGNETATEELDEIPSSLPTAAEEVPSFVLPVGEEEDSDFVPPSQEESTDDEQVPLFTPPADNSPPDVLASDSPTAPAEAVSGLDSLLAGSEDTDVPAEFVPPAVGLAVEDNDVHVPSLTSQSASEAAEPTECAGCGEVSFSGQTELDEAEQEALAVEKLKAMNSVTDIFTDASAMFTRYGFERVFSVSDVSATEFLSQLGRIDLATEFSARDAQSQSDCILGVLAELKACAYDLVEVGEYAKANDILQPLIKVLYEE